MTATNLLGMPILVEPLWEDTLAATGLDPIKTAAEARTITHSKWDEIMTTDKPATGEQKVVNNGKQGQGTGRTAAQPGGARRRPAKRSVQPRADAGTEGREAGAQPSEGAVRDGHPAG